MSSPPLPVALAVPVQLAGDRSALLLHGLTSSSQGWWRVAPRLQAAGFGVTAPDLRGHGLSPPGARYAMDDYVDDVLGLGSGWDLLVGHSLGGAIAARAVQLQPDFARRVVLLDPALVVPEEHRLSRVAQQPRAPRSAAEVLTEHPGWAPEDADAQAWAEAHNADDVERRTYSDNPGWDYSPAIRLSATPTLILGADVGPVVCIPHWFGEQLAETPGVEFATITAAGHSPHRDRPDETLARLLAFATAG